MPLQGHQQQRLIRGNEHDPDGGFTRNPEEGRSEPCDAEKEGQVRIMLEWCGLMDKDS